VQTEEEAFTGSIWDEVKALGDKEEKVPVVILCEKNRPGFWITGRGSG